MRVLAVFHRSVFKLNTNLRNRFDTVNFEPKAWNFKLYYKLNKQYKILYIWMRCFLGKMAPTCVA